MTYNNHDHVENAAHYDDEVKYVPHVAKVVLKIRWFVDYIGFRQQQKTVHKYSYELILSI